MRSRRGEPWGTATAAEARYARQLRKIARHIDDLVKGMPPDDPRAAAQIEEVLKGYEELIGPWAEATAGRMLEDVSKKDFAAWEKTGKAIGRELRRETVTAPTAPAMRKLLEEQVDLIKSMPREAAKRVQKLALEATVTGKRWEEVATEIHQQGHVSRSQANLVARTETGRASAIMTQVRAEHIGSPGWWWTSVMDADTRPRHRELHGTYHRWGDLPPIASEPGQREMRYLPGAGPNCRCWITPLVGPEPADLQARRKRPSRRAFERALREAGYQV